MWTIRRTMVRPIHNPLMLSIAPRGSYRYILPLLLLLVLMILLPRRTSNTDNLIITSSGAGGQHILKFGVETTFKPMLLIGISTDIFGGIL